MNILIQSMLYNPCYTIHFLQSLLQSPIYTVQSIQSMLYSPCYTVHVIQFMLHSSCYTVCYKVQVISPFSFNSVTIGAMFEQQRAGWSWLVRLDSLRSCFYSLGVDTDKNIEYSNMDISGYFTQYAAKLLKNLEIIIVKTRAC